MRISTITLNLALKIGTTEIFNQIEKFSKEATENEYTIFTHTNFFYSYPEFGKKWSNGKDCEFHQVNTKCHLCDYTPDRNYAGYGDIYILNNGICNNEILVHEGKGNCYVPNTARLSQMILLCDNHVGSYFLWDKSAKKINKIGSQLQLF